MLDLNIGLESLKAGAFLSSGTNVMTIGWGYFGVMWGKKVFIAPVRYSRHTKKFLDHTKEFAVSFPKTGDMTKELKICGTKSGRDTNKLALLNTFEASKIGTSLISGCEHYIECKLMATIPVAMENLEPSAKEFYKNGDLHVLYIGEIL